MNILRNTLLSAATIITLAFTTVPLANAAEPVQTQIQSQAQAQPEILTVLPPTDIISPKNVSISFSSPVITSEPAPLPVIEVVPEPVQALVAEVTLAPQVQQSATAPAPAPVPTAQPVSGSGAALAASAYAQLGVAQDCTRMVENALGSIGIVTGDIGPSNFFGFGQIVGDPQPGDLMVQGNAHVAIYVGNGMAISGGYNGQNTVLHPASYLTGAAYVRVG